MPTRSDLTTAQQTVLASSAFDIFFTVTIEYSNETARMWSGAGEKVIAGETYAGVGSLLGLGEIRESGDLAAHNLQLTLSGVPSTLLSAALNIQYRNAKCTISQGFSTAGGTEHVIPAYVGFIDSMAIEEGGDTSSISVIVESAIALLGRPTPLRYTHASQQSRYPGDKGFEFVESLQNRAIAWGGEGNATLEKS